MIVGIDYSTLAIDLVLLDEDHDTAVHHRRRIDIGPGKAFDRIRRIRDVLPPRTAWGDSGVVLFAIEEPFAYGNMNSLPALLMAFGVIVACLPTEVPIAPLRADEWRRSCGLRTRGKREELKREAIAFARERWSDAPAAVDDNIADAFGVAWAGRELFEKWERERSAA